MRREIVGVLATLVLCSSCATTDAARLHARALVELPAVLHGTWEIGPGPCKLPGNPDSDSRIVVEARAVIGYEDRSEVLAIKGVAAAPQAWVVRLREHYQGEVREFDVIMSVTARDRGSLVIIDESRPETYVRCA